MAAKYPLRIHSHKFFAALQEAGIFSTGDYVRRIVIDVCVGEAVVMYVERYGDERLLGVLTTLDGIRIETGEPAETAPAGEAV